MLFLCNKWDIIRGRECAFLYEKDLYEIIPLLIPGLEIARVYKRPFPD